MFDKSAGIRNYMVNGINGKITTGNPEGCPMSFQRGAAIYPIDDPPPLKR